MEEITKEFIATLTEEEKKDLYDLLLSKGIDKVFLKHLIYGRDYHDVMTKDNNNNET